MVTSRAAGQRQCHRPLRRVTTAAARGHTDAHLQGPGCLGPDLPSKGLAQSGLSKDVGLPPEDLQGQGSTPVPSPAREGQRRGPGTQHRLTHGVLLPLARAHISTPSPWPQFHVGFGSKAQKAVGDSKHTSCGQTACAGQAGPVPLHLRPRGGQTRSLSAACARQPTTAAGAIGASAPTQGRRALLCTSVPGCAFLVVPE